MSPQIPFDNCTEIGYFGRQTYYKSDDLVQCWMAHGNGRVLGIMAGEEVARGRSCKSLNGCCHCCGRRGW